MLIPRKFRVRWKIWFPGTCVEMVVVGFWVVSSTWVLVAAAEMGVLMLAIGHRLLSGAHAGYMAAS
jgi:predicted anti-sigma-YlaC factor YlaD